MSNLTDKDMAAGHLNTSGHTYYWMRHRNMSILNKLARVTGPYVKCGYDAHQIQDELRKETGFTPSLEQLELAISINLGEQQ